MTEETIRLANQPTNNPMPGCQICETPWPELGSFRHWRATVSDEQNYLGKCIIALRRHEEDFLALTQEEREEMWEAAGEVRSALTRCFAPDHFNYQVLGNSVRHVHVHLTPRYASPREFAGVTFTDEHWGTWPLPSDQELPPGFLKSLAGAVAGEMSSKGAPK